VVILSGPDGRVGTDRALLVYLGSSSVTSAFKRCVSS
jgi:hypothetical protein